MKIIFILTILMSLNSYSHEGHGVPGSIPPAPNGGVLEEADHMHHGSHNHDHKEASDREIFFEGLYKKGKLLVFPLQLDPKGHKHFISLKSEDFKDVKIEVVDARKKDKIKAELKTGSLDWSIDVSKVRARRFILHVSGIYKGAKYHAKVQVEKK